MLTQRLISRYPRRGQEKNGIWNYTELSTSTQDQIHKRISELSRFTPLGNNIMTEIIYGNVSYQGTTVSSVSALMSAYLVNATDGMRSKAKLWEKEFIALMEDFNEDSEWLKIYYSSEVITVTSLQLYVWINWIVRSIRDRFRTNSTAKSMPICP